MLVRTFKRAFSSTLGDAWRTAKEVTVAIPGLNLSGLSLGDESSPLKVMALHGWMDNAHTHKYTGPVWAELGYHFVALDLPGHGKSGKKTLADTYDSGGYARAAMEAANAMGWHAFSLCSHSMGAGVSSMVAGAWADRVASLVVLEGIGMNTKEETVSPSALAASVAGRAKLFAKFNGENAGKIYHTKKDASMARVATTRRYPGNQSITYHAAEALIERGTMPVEGGVKFTHDFRLMEPSSLYLSESQMSTYLKSVRAPSLCVTGTEGWPWAEGLMLNRISQVRDMEHHHLYGGHHLHLDESTGPDVASILESFLTRRDRDIRAIYDANSKRTHRKHAVNGPTAINLTATKTADGSNVDHDAVHGAESIASTTVKEELSSLRHSATFADEHATDAWTSRHVHVCITRPLGSDKTGFVAAPQDGMRRVHLQPNVLVPLRTVDGFKPLFDLPATAVTNSKNPDLAWSKFTDGCSGFNSKLARSYGVLDVEFGSWAPKVFLQSMPTLEAVTNQAITGASHDAASLAQAKASLESRGSSY